MITLNATGATGIVNYHWNLLALTHDAATQLSAGAYSVTVTDAAGCSVTFDTLVTQPPRFEASVYTEPTTCTGINDGILVIDDILGARGPVLYSINNTAFLPVDSLPMIIPDLSSGPFDLVLTDSAGCMEHLSLVVPLGETPSINLGSERSIFSGDSVLLDFTTTLSPAQINWSPANVVSCTTCPATYAFPPTDQYVTLSLVDSSGCTATDSILILVFVPKQVYIPNVFSPNGDDINDKFYIQANAFAEEVDYLLVVDRGNAVYERSHFPVNDPDYGWDGTLNGKMMFPAVFTYLTRVRFTDGQVIPFSGTVTLVR